MSYVVLARKYRPQRFADLVGQEAAARTIQNAIRIGRVAHAYLLVGPRGLGKTTTARLLARAVNCAEGPAPEPCGACDPCREIAHGTCVDVVEIDAASNRGIDEIRDLRERVHLAPAACRRKVYIIDEVHMLTNEAFNALLKTLEEPPAHVLFALATTEPQRVPETVRSRCQRFDFRPIPEARVVERLRLIAEAEKITASDEALRLIARAAGGGMRDAISLLDQSATLGGGAATPDSVAEATGAVPEALAARAAEAVEARDLSAALEALAAVEAAGHDLSSLGAALLDRFRRHLRRAAAGEETPLAGRRLLESIDLLIAALDRARRTPHPAALWEAAVGRLCLLGEEEDGLERLADRLEAVAERLVGAEATPESVVGASPAAIGAPAPRPRDPPASRVAAASAPGLAASGVLLERIVRSWSDVVERVKAARGPRVAAFLKESRPAAIEGGALVLEFFQAFHHRGFAGDAQGIGAVAEAVGGLAGRPFSIVPRLAAGAAPSAPHAEAAPTGAPDAAKGRPEDEPLVAAALGIFGGEVIGTE